MVMSVIVRNGLGWGGASLLSKFLLLPLVLCFGLQDMAKVALRLSRKVEKSSEGASRYETLKYTELESRYGKDKAAKIAKKKARQGLIIPDPELPDDEDCHGK